MGYFELAENLVFGSQPGRKDLEHLEDNGKKPWSICVSPMRKNRSCRPMRNERRPKS